MENNEKNQLGFNQKCYEVNLPEYLEKHLEAFKEELKNKSSLLDCLWGELYSSINSAMWDGQITKEQAEYLRNKYLWKDEE